MSTKDEPEQIYDVMTVPKLKQLCKDRGIIGYSRMNKAELINMLLN